MQWIDVLKTLNDLPSTFTRSGPNFAAFQASLTNGLHKFTGSVEGALLQAQPTQAVGKWLDVVGKLRNIPRFNDESDSDYLTRITYLLTTAGGPPNALLGVMMTIGQTSATITENFSACSWSINVIGGTPSGATLSQITSSLGYVRPAGVPYAINVSAGGLFLNTLNYLGRPRVTGAYITNASTNLPLNLSANTNNAINLLPTTYLTDPTLNPSLAT